MAVKLRAVDEVFGREVRGCVLAIGGGKEGGQFRGARGAGGYAEAGPRQGYT